MKQIIGAEMVEGIDAKKLLEEINWSSLKMQRLQKESDLEKREFDNNQTSSFVQRIRTIFAREQSDMDKRYSSFHTTMLEIRSELDFEARVLKIKESLEDMQQAVKRQIPKLRIARTKYQEEKEDFDNYRAINGLTRPAIEKPGITYFFDLGGILAAEALGNMAMLIPVSPGLKTAMVYSLMIAFVNLGTMFLIGYFGTKGFYSRHLWRKIGGYLAIVYALTVMPFFHWFVSMYRSQASLATNSLERGEITSLPAEGDMFNAVVEYLSNAGLGFIDLTGFLMFFIGLLMGLYAWYKGHHYGDKIAEYAARDKMLQKRHDDFLVPSEVLRDSILDLRNEVLDEISEYLSMLQPRVQNMDMHAARIDGFEKSLIRFCDSCRSTAQVFINQYKSEVLQGEVPDWFASIEEQALQSIEPESHFAVNVAEAKGLAERAHQAVQIEKPRAEAYQEEAFKKVDQLQVKVEKLLEGVEQ